MARWGLSSQPGQHLARTSTPELTKCRADAKASCGQCAHFQWFRFSMEFSDCFMAGNCSRMERRTFRNDQVRSPVRRSGQTRQIEEKKNEWPREIWKMTRPVIHREVRRRSGRISLCEYPAHRV